MPKRPITKATVLPHPASGVSTASGNGNPVISGKQFWLRVARTVLTSRAIDRIEEQEMTPKGLVTYQFSARGHDLAQAILSECITHPHDGATCYYRSRPFVLGQGLTAEEAFRGSLARAGGMTDGR